jgi:hypothetical protein
MCGMARVRVSTTVDGETLAGLRLALGVSDSELLDRALGMLSEAVEAEAEQRALREMPYQDDPDLGWNAPVAAPLVYDGDVPPHVLELARSRRGER